MCPTFDHFSANMTENIAFKVVANIFTLPKYFHNIYNDLNFLYFVSPSKLTPYFSLVYQTVEFT